MHCLDEARGSLSRRGPGVHCLDEARDALSRRDPGGALS